jgi:hypothetical protein
MSSRNLICIANDWISDLESQYPSSQNAFDQLERSINTNRITNFGMSMGHLSPKVQSEVRIYARWIISEERNGLQIITG